MNYISKVVAPLLFASLALSCNQRPLEERMEMKQSAYVLDKYIGTDGKEKVSFYGRFVDFTIDAEQLSSDIKEHTSVVISYEEVFRYTKERDLITKKSYWAKTHVDFEFKRAVPKKE